VVKAKPAKRPEDDTKAPSPVRGSRVQNVYETIRREILEMSLAPGEQLDETKLAARFATSRTPIREALVRLTAEGLVNTLPNRNSMVSVIDFRSASSYLDALMLMYRVTCRLAAQRRTDNDIDKLRTWQARYTRAAAESDAIGMIEFNLEFHIAISQAGQNGYFTDFIRRLLSEGQRILRIYYLSLEEQLPKIYDDDHDAIIRAIENRDADTADRLGAEHAEQVVENLKSFLSSGVGQDIKLDTDFSEKK
jgi:DNA-binding GntR family transcriptional regulator